jgi:hypothetical protein
LVEDVRDGLCGEGTSPVRLCEREVDLGRAVGVEQSEQAKGGATEMAAVDGDAFEEHLGMGAGGHQAVSSTVLARVALFVGEPVEMVWVFDFAMPSRCRPCALPRAAACPMAG